jgi:hypothetical protein
MFDTLNENNFIQYCMNNYDNPQCHTLKEFEEDLNRIAYLQKLLYRYKYNSELRERLILNHLIVLINVFGKAAVNILFYKVNPKYWNVLMTFLLYLNVMPDSLPQYNIVLSDFELDLEVYSVLKDI